MVEASFITLAPERTGLFRLSRRIDDWVRQSANTTKPTALRIINNMPKLLIIPRQDTAVGYYRQELPARILRKLGYDVLFDLTVMA